MCQTTTIAKRRGGDADGVDLAELPDARVTIDLEQVDDDEWVAFDPDDDEGIIGRGETGPRAAEDYCRRVAEHLESRGSP